jgi:5-deoxy-glucuronate isomerase
MMGEDLMHNLRFSTPASPGLHEIIDARNSDLDVLSLAVLNGDAQASFPAGEREYCCVTVQGEATGKVAGKAYQLAEGDCLYVPRGTAFSLTGQSAVARVAVCSAVADADTAVIYRRFADSWNSPEGHETHGKYNFTRDVVNLLFRSDNARKIVAGITVGQDGLWTSWPPHHHSDTLEEIYYYFGIPASGFGIHVAIFGDGRERAEIVHSGDAVIVPEGYHPTVASPGSRMKYVWFLGAKRSEADRRAKTIDHPSYA